MKSNKIVLGDHKLMFNTDWDEKEKILIKDKLEYKIFVNQKFADNCKFGIFCVFIKCKFGSDCEFGFGCNKNKPYWDENGKQE